MINKLKNIDFKKYAMIIALVVISAFFQITTNGILLKPMNVSNLIMQNAYILILAIGMLPVILTGNIDLSVGSVLAFVSAISGVMIIGNNLPVWITILICLIVGLLVGAWQGFWIAYMGIPSFIVTLAGMLVFRGLTLVILGGNTIAPFPQTYRYLSAGYFPADSPNRLLISLSVGIVISLLYMTITFSTRRKNIKNEYPIESKAIFIAKNISVSLLTVYFFYWIGLYKGIPIVLFLLLILMIIYNFITQNTTIGRSIYAFGGNEKATRLSGINTKFIFFLTYVNMGLLSAVAGLVFSGRLNAVAPSIGEGFELDAIAACYIGGASANGGVGTIVGAVIGGLVMGVLNNGMSIMGIGIDWQQAIKGLVLLAAVAFDIYNKKKKVVSE